MNYNNVYLRPLRNDIDFAAAVSTPNQKSTAVAVEALSFTNPVYQAAVAHTEENAGAAYDQLSGGIYAFAHTALVADASLPRIAILSRLQREPRRARCMVEDLWELGSQRW